MARIKATTEEETPILSADEQARLEQEAIQEFEEEQKAELSAAFKEETKKRLRKRALFSEAGDSKGSDLVSVTINLAPHAPYITLDGRMFYHMATYSLSRAQAASVNEIMERTWRHEEEIGGVNSAAVNGRKHQNLRVSPTSQTGE